MGCDNSKDVTVSKGKSDSTGGQAKEQKQKTNEQNMGCGNSKDVTVSKEKSDSTRGKAKEQKQKTNEQNMGCGNSKDVTVSKEKSAGGQAKEQKQNTHEHKRDKETPYKQIDEHARKAPTSLKNSADDLVNYFSSVSKEPKILVRGFYVWISENIKYDVEGYFGRAKHAPCDSEGVMKCGRSVCEGYANVMQDLCRKANIPVKKITGFAKGYGHSADQIISESSKINHAWNAVQLEDKWCLVDSTWGAGHVTQSGQFEKKLNEFYFIASPKHMITNHFPYMNGNMEESMKWQLLDEPVSLPEFSRRVKYSPEAFLLGARAVSHTNGFIEMKNELKMIFKSEGSDDIAFSTRLMLRQGNMLREQRNVTYGYLENGVFTFLVNPPKVGTYTMDVFGRPVSEEKPSSNHLMTYTIKCTAVKDNNFEYPLTYANHSRERVILRKPMSGKLPANTEVSFEIEATYLQTIKAGNTLLEKSGTTFSGLVKTGAAGHLSVFGNRAGKYDIMDGLLQYTVVK